MDSFKGLVKDTEIINNPIGTWQYAKNILLVKSINSIADEDGFDFISAIKGNLIGIIPTNKETVVFSKNEEISEIGIIAEKNNSFEYQKIVGSIYFNFNIKNPIEGVYIYDYKGDLIICFSDGNKEDSNSPKLINLTTLGVPLDINKNVTNVAEFEKFNLFPKTKQSPIDITYTETGAIEGFAAYITYAYVFEDGSITNYFPIDNLAYLGTGFNPVNKKGIRLTFNNLDTIFNKIKIGIVLKGDKDFTAFESYEIFYENSQKIIDINSLSNFTKVSPEKIVIEKSIFEKIETITKYENQVLVANTKTKDKIKFQKYANLIKLEPYLYKEINTSQEASLMPDEVYAFYVQVKFLDNTYSEAFHIPNLNKKNNEDLVLTTAQKTEFNLNWAADYKQFHILNNGFISPANNINSFGYWENDENYPNTEDFDSRIDYDNLPLNGTDLRNKKITYHRIPSLTTIFEQSQNDGIITTNLEKQDFYKVGVKILNFSDVIPNKIKNQIKGYRISFIKRDFGNSLVSGNLIMTRRNEQSWKQANVPITWQYYDFNINETSDELFFGSLNFNYDKGRIISPELFKIKPNIDLTYIKSNFLINVVNNKYEQVNNANKFAKVKPNLIYVLGDNIVEKTQYHEEGINLDLDTVNYLQKIGNLFTLDSRYFVINLTAFSHKLNLYSGFKSNNLIVLGSSLDFNNNKILKGGDVFNTSEININTHTVKKHRTSASDRTLMMQYNTPIKLKGIYSPLNYSQLFNENKDDESEFTIGDNERANRIPVDFFNSRDYTFKIKQEEALSSLHDINTILTFDFENKFINQFPFRVNKGLKVPNEGLTTDALRTFLSSEYQEMPNDKGEIIAIRGKNRALFIQHRFTLFVASVKDKLRTGEVDAYLGTPELFERNPEELQSDDKGYIGCTSKFACGVFRSIYVVVDQLNGSIFLIDDKGLTEITNKGNRNWFKENWDIGLSFFKFLNNKKVRIDNPYNSIGHLISFDRKYNRFLFTKRNFKFKKPELLTSGIVTFDGEFYKKDNQIIPYQNNEFFNNLSETISYSLDDEKFICFHDYFPIASYYTNSNLFSFNFDYVSNKINLYKHNSLINKRIFYGNRYSSYVDIIFNNTKTISKTIVHLELTTEVKTVKNTINNNKTIDKLLIYNDKQSTELIKTEEFKNFRFVNSKFRFSNFRDFIKDKNQEIIFKNGEINFDNLDLGKLFFERSILLNNYFVVRLYIDNMSNDTTYIHDVTLKMLKQER